MGSYIRYFHELPHPKRPNFASFCPILLLIFPVLLLIGGARAPPGPFLRCANAGSSGNPMTIILRTWTHFQQRWQLLFIITSIIMKLFSILLIIFFLCNHFEDKVFSIIKHRLEVKVIQTVLELTFVCS